MNDNLNEVSYLLMRTFNWTPKEVDDIPIPTVQMILENLKEEHREEERQKRLVELRARRK